MRVVGVLMHLVLVHGAHHWRHHLVVSERQVLIALTVGRRVSAEFVLSRIALEVIPVVVGANSGYDLIVKSCHVVDV